MTTEDKIAQERLKAQDKLRFLNTIEHADEELAVLKHNAKETESKELEIHLMWKNYEEL